MPNASVRIALLVIAAGTVGWAAVGLRNQDALDRGTALVSSARPAPADRAAAIHDFRDAQSLNASNLPAVAIAIQQLALGQRDAAISTLNGVLRREPENSVAWGGLAIALRPEDPVQAARAARRARALNPLG
ncbi:MAG: hypothetical protein U0R70_17085 [Solirubrobacteraceae bacterium]